MSKKLICYALTLALVAGGISVTATGAKKAKLSFTKATLKVGEKKTVKIKNKVKKAKYSFASSKKTVVSVNKKGVITAKSAGNAKITVKEVVKKKSRKVGTIKVTVNSISDNVTATIAPSTAAPLPTTTPQSTKEPEVLGTPDPYTKNVMSFYLKDKDEYVVNGATCDVTMTFLDVEVEGEYFNGNDKANGGSGNGSSVVCKDYKEGDKLYCYRYLVVGTDDTGKSCKMFIEDNGIELADGNIITDPIIFTDSKSLSWLETADLQGRVSKAGDETVIDIMWNESNTEPVLPEPVVRPDESKNYNKELFQFKIDIGGAPDVTGNTGNASMIFFGVSADTANFKGKGVSTNFFDTRKQFLKPERQVQTLSARYILEGTDCNGDPCKIYVENNGIDDNGMVTEPTIITSSPEYAYIETAPLHGTVSWGDKLTIHMWTTSN